GRGHRLAKLFEAVADGGVEDRVADAQDDAAEHVGVDLAGELDLAAGLLADGVDDALDGRGVERDGRGGDYRQELVLTLPEAVELAADAEDRRHPVLLDEQGEEVRDRLAGADDGACERVLLLLGREVRRE